MDLYYISCSHVSFYNSLPQDGGIGKRVYTILAYTYNNERERVRRFLPKFRWRRGKVTKLTKMHVQSIGNYLLW